MKDNLIETIYKCKFKIQDEFNIRSILQEGPYGHNEHYITDKRYKKLFKPTPEEKKEDNKY